MSWRADDVRKELTDLVDTSGAVAIVDPAGMTLPYVASKVKELSEHGCHVEVFTSYTRYNQGMLTDACQSHRAGLHQFFVSKSMQPNRVMGLIAYLRMVMAITVWSRTVRGTIFLNFGAFGIFDALLLLLVGRKRTIYICHNPVEHGKHRISYDNLLKSWLAARVVVLSRYSEKLFCRLYPRSLQKKLIRVSHGPIVARWSDFVHLPVERPIEKRVVFIGRVEPYKAASIVHLLAKRLPEFVVEVYGKNAGSVSQQQGDTSEPLTNLILNDAFINEDTLSTLVNSGSIFVLPYHHATQSGVLWLLKTYQCYYVSSRAVGLLQDIPRSRRNERTYHYGDLDELVCKIQSLYKHYHSQPTPKYVE